MRKARILVAEDDPHIREGLVDLLSGEGYEVTAAADGAAALRHWGQDRFDVVLLDIMMPGASGYDVCRQIRRTDPDVRILMLTAKSEEVDKVVGLELGADDYVTKPFGIRELVARVAVQLRRAQRPHAGEPDDDRPPVFRFGRAEIDRRALRGRLAGRPFDLTPRELALLEFLLDRPGMAVSRERLLRSVWGYEYGGTTRTVDQHVAQLRKKIEPDPERPTVLTTVHGLGYRYEGDPEAEPTA